MKLFGTDGVRGKAGDFLDAMTALKLAQAAGIYFNNVSTKKSKKILLGKDTRRSGYMIENALVSGFTSVGYDVIQIGPMPTPAIAYLTESMRCDAGIMLSASHNPFEDNGIKFFNCKGDKLNTDVEAKIEEIFYDEKLLASSQATGKNIGKAKRIDDVIGRYIVSIKTSFPKAMSLNNLRIVLDCANGAAYKVAPTILEELGADLIVLNNKPDGFNINEDCGALHPQNIGKVIREYRADIGIALDGDADRLVIVDEKGEVIDGVRVKNKDIKIETDKVRPDNVVRFSTGSASRDNLIKHPAPYHKDLPLYYINLLTDSGDLVIDTFSGIGTTGIACKDLERNYIGYELNKTYADFSKKRLGI